MEEVHVPGDTVRVLVGVLEQGLFAVSLDGIETEETRTSLPYQEVDGSVNISPPPRGDGRYKLGEEVTLLASPRSGWLLTWGGVDRLDRSFARVRMVADRLVSVNIFPPSTPLSLPAPSHRSAPIPGQSRVFPSGTVP